MMTFAEIMFYPLSYSVVTFAILRLALTAILIHRSVWHFRELEPLRGSLLMAYAVVMFLSTMDSPSNPNGQVLTVATCAIYLIQMGYFGRDIWLNVKRRLWHKTGRW